jgi:hypothetical protein
MMRLQKKLIYYIGIIRFLFNKKFLFYVDANSTHGYFLERTIQYLIDDLGKNQELVLFEFGTGGTSSKIMRNFLDNDNRIHLYSFESDLKWIELHKKLYSRCNRHRLVYVDNEEWAVNIGREMGAISADARFLAFIDSYPWSSRVTALNEVKNRADIFLVHDVDYFPHNKIFGKELSNIRFNKSGLIRYGKLDRNYLGSRNYDDIAKFWVEAFPEFPGYFTGPPTLIGSNVHDVRTINWVPESIIFASD